jgi:hypothetical protein
MIRTAFREVKDFVGGLRTSFQVSESLCEGMQSIKTHVIALFIIAIAGCFPVALAQADQTVITNNVSVSASTGGNNASNGSVQEGTATARVTSETTVNGVTVNAVNEERTGSDVSIVASTTYRNGVASSTVQVTGDGKNTTESGTHIVAPRAQLQESLAAASTSITVVAEGTTTARSTEVKGGIFNRIRNFFHYVFSFFIH